MLARHGHRASTAMWDSDPQLRLFSSYPTDEGAAGLRVVWVFRRGDEEMRVAHVEDDRRLIVTPPGVTPMQRRFDTVPALIAFQSELLQQLRREGWVLQHVEPDRRSGRDRRRGSRPDADRRQL